MAGYIGNSPTPVPLTSADLADSIITSAKIVDGTIVNADINASAGIDASKLSGVTSDFVLLATTTASSSASISFDGYFSATYNNYQVILYDVFPASSGGYLRIRLRKSNADVTSANYTHGGGGQYQHSGIGSGFAYYGSGAGATSIGTLSENGTVSTSDYAYNQKVHIYNPLATNTYKTITQEIGLIKRTNETNYTITIVGGSGLLYDNTNALSGITFLMSTGNIASGTFKLYGLK
jgi:hypothetical protein